MNTKQLMKRIAAGAVAMSLLLGAGTASAASVFFQGISIVDPSVQGTMIIDVEITDVGTNSFWTTFDLSVQLEPVVGLLNATFSSVQNVSGEPDYVFEGTSNAFNSVIGSGSVTANSSDATSLADGVPASLDNPLMARFVIDISGTSPGQQFKISLCDTGVGCLNTNRLDGFDDNSIPRIDSIVANDKTISVVPIPAAAWLFGSALGLLGWIRRRAT